MEHPLKISIDNFDDLVPIADIHNSSASLSNEIPTIHNDDNDSMQFTPKIER